MYTQHTISVILPSSYQNLLKFVEIWQNSNKNKNAPFFLRHSNLCTSWCQPTLCFKKKLHPFYFCDKFVGHEPMLIIFGKNVDKEIGNMQILTWLLLTVQMSYVENQLKRCQCSRKHVVFNVEGRILVKNLYKLKGYRAKKYSKFPDKGWTVNGLNYLLKKVRNIATLGRQPGSGRRQSARKVENVDTVNDLVLSHKGALKCIKPRVKLQGRPAFITRQCTALFIRIFRIFN